VGGGGGADGQAPKMNGGSSRVHDLGFEEYTSHRTFASPETMTLNVLMIATKPPWPLVDGGRLLVRHTLEGLTAAGHGVTLVAPAATAGPDLEEVSRALMPWCTPRLVPARPRSLWISLLRSRLDGTALSVARHTLPAVHGEVARCLERERFDVVHVEQLQAMAQAAPARRRGLPVVLRAQNVESDLWSGMAGAGNRLQGLLGRQEARHLARSEGAAVARASAVVALTRRDAERLERLGGRAVHVVRAPFPASLDAAEKRLEGKPAVVQLGSEGWLPNRDSVGFFAASIWPAVRRALPEARLHVFGNPGRDAVPGIVWHGHPADSREAFAPGAVLVVPLRVASGIRMKILEAWARGVPVVATPQAAAGLDAENGRHLLVADGEASFVAAFERLHREDGLYASLAAAGREWLRERHDPAGSTAELVAVYEAAIAAGNGT